jgi:hypothetical protein
VTLTSAMAVPLLAAIITGGEQAEAIVGLTREVASLRRVISFDPVDADVGGFDELLRSQPAESRRTSLPVRPGQRSYICPRRRVHAILPRLGSTHVQRPRSVSLLASQVLESALATKAPLALRPRLLRLQ